MLLNRLRVPNLIGMIVAGVIVGEHGLNVLQRDASFELFGKVGIYFIMFLAGLEMDMQSFRKNKNHGLVFGWFTTLIPFVFGYVSGYYLLGYSVPASLLLACILASHTLVSYPIVARYGISKNPAVTVSVVATMVALVVSLVVLAGVTGVMRGENNLWFWIWFVIKLSLYIVILFVVVPRAIRMFFRNVSDPKLQFIYTLAIIFFSAAFAEVCGVEGILGAFLSGLVLNRFVPKSSPLMNRLEFVGNAIFVPYFLIGVGMIVNVAPMFKEWNALYVVIVIVVAATLSKYLAAVACQYLFKYTKHQGVMMFGLTEAQAAGSLAMVMVGIKLEERPGVPLMDNTILEGVVMMILITCVISSFATEYSAKQLKIDERVGDHESGKRQDSTSRDDEKMLVPINEPSNIETLMGAAVMMRNKKLNRGLICLNMIEDSNMSIAAQAHSKECLDIARQVAAAADVPIQTQTRLAVNFATAAIHSMMENDASEMVIGLHHKRYENDSFLGTFANGLINGMNRQLTIVNMKIPANTVRRIIVALPENAEFEKGFYRWINRIARMAEDLGCIIEFNAPAVTDKLIMKYMKDRHKSARAEYRNLENWGDFVQLKEKVSSDHLFVVVTARKGGISYQHSFSKLFNIIQNDFNHCSLMIIFPDQEGEVQESLFNG